MATSISTDKLNAKAHERCINDLLINEYQGSQKHLSYKDKEVNIVSNSIFTHLALMYLHDL